MTTKRNVFVALACAALLGACGGGGGDTPVTPSTDAVPDEASTSATGMSDWLKLLAATAPEDREALDVARFAPPQPDDTEPVAVQ